MFVCEPICRLDQQLISGVPDENEPPTPTYLYSLAR
jgi:hypothetical protein